MMTVSKLFLGLVTRGWGLGKSWKDPSPEPQAPSPQASFKTISGAPGYE